MSEAETFKKMTDRQLRAYFRLTREEAAYEEIIRRGPNEKDREMLRAFNEWLAIQDSSQQ